MHEVWFAQGVYGVDIQGMADHGELGGNSLVNKEGERSFVFLVFFWSYVPFSFQSSRLISEAFITI